MEIVVRQISGLGNQLFQYAAGRYYAEQYGASLRIALDPKTRAFSHGHPRPFLLSKFAIQAPVSEIKRWEMLMLSTQPKFAPLSQLLQGATGSQVYRESIAQRYTFIPDLGVRPGRRALYLAGYWQTYRIAEALGARLCHELSLRESASGKTLEVAERIRQARTAVSLHVRRGDYTLASEGNIALPMDYYGRAIARMTEQFEDVTFFVFSDDIEFTRANLPAGLNAEFVDHNNDATSHEDLYLMSQCQHHILANSTFSWWGAWLNPSATKVVLAPKQWHLRADTYYPELMPLSWELLDV
jgi:hypothetical protein